MWLAATFDLTASDREFGWSAALGMNTHSVFLHVSSGRRTLRASRCRAPRFEVLNHYWRAAFAVVPLRLVCHGLDTVTQRANRRPAHFMRVALLKAFISSAVISGILWCISMALISADFRGVVPYGAQVHTVYWLLFPGPQITPVLEQVLGSFEHPLICTGVVTFLFWLIVSTSWQYVRVLQHHRTINSAAG